MIKKMNWLKNLGSANISQKVDIDQSEWIMHNYYCEKNMIGRDIFGCGIFK